VPVRIVYSDLDGTMVGARGCFLRAEDASVTLEPAQALGRLLASGVPLVLVSGRTRAQLLEACLVFGADGFVAELGGLLGWDHGRSVELLRGAMPDRLDRVPEEVIETLLARFPGRLAYHDPWHLGHELDVMLRGLVEVAEAEAVLAEAGAPWLRVRDNGRLPRAAPGGGPVHVYHVVPDGVSKGAAVARDLARRGLAPDDAIAIGDSASDLEMAPYVGRLHLVANGARVPHVAARLADHRNVVVERRAAGLGWTDAVLAAIGAGGGGGCSADPPLA
jgi:hypothetical protein